MYEIIISLDKNDDWKSSSVVVDRIDGHQNAERLNLNAVAGNHDVWQTLSTT
jgi:hypothetical protein